MSWQSKKVEAFFSTAVEPMKISMLTPRSEESEPRVIPYNMKSRSVQKTVCWFDLRIA